MWQRRLGRGAGRGGGELTDPSGAIRPAVEAALAVAREGLSADPVVLPPHALRPYLDFARLSSNALKAIARAVDRDDEFRARVVGGGRRGIRGPRRLAVAGAPRRLGGRAGHDRGRAGHPGGRGPAGAATSARRHPARWPPRRRPPPRPRPRRPSGAGSCSWPVQLGEERKLRGEAVDRLADAEAEVARLVGGPDRGRAQAQGGRVAAGRALDRAQRGQGSPPAPGAGGSCGRRRSGGRACRRRGRGAAAGCPAGGGAGRRAGRGSPAGRRARGDARAHDEVGDARPRPRRTVGEAGGGPGAGGGAARRADPPGGQGRRRGRRPGRRVGRGDVPARRHGRPVPAGPPGDRRSDARRLRRRRRARAEAARRRRAPRTTSAAAGRRGAPAAPPGCPSGCPAGSSTTRWRRRATCCGLPAPCWWWTATT